MADITPPLSTKNSPLLRPSSPSPDVSPSLALGACPLLDRSVSTPSTSSAFSSRSVSSASDGGSTAARRRGYMRPQGTWFADSARNRDSVMSLGSIAHMQYYFARTGLLDGKGAQLAKQRKSGIESENDTAVTIFDADSAVTDGTVTPSHSEHDFFDPAVSTTTSVNGHDTDDHWSRGIGFGMLPPTVSTYKHKADYVQPLPDIAVLRRELRESLDGARKLLEETSCEAFQSSGESTVCITSGSSSNQGWYELQGLHILDIVTLAIRAAKNYYTCHSNPQKLYAIKSERSIRIELYHCLDLLKRTANREFQGGLREAEKHGILDWIASIHLLLSQEEEQEKQDRTLRDKWTWLQGDWEGKEREREWLFLRSFDGDVELLPPWTKPEDGPSPFLTTLQNGVRLVRLHNELVKQSRRRFGEIKTYHTDVGKPYRCAENLRYWAKASELRWETKLNVNALDVVYGKDDATWKQFDQAVLKWCRAVREELSGEWLGTDGGTSTLPPHIHVELEA